MKENQAIAKTGKIIPLFIGILLSSCGFHDFPSSSLSGSFSSPNFSSFSETSSSPIDSSSSTSSAENNAIELISDPTFKTGFYLKSPETTNVYTERHFDYQGTATPNQQVWNMAQWWTPFNFGLASETRVADHQYRYENESRYFEVNSETGAMSFGLDSWKEYQKKFGGSRTSGSQNWSHFLLEQDFQNSVHLSQLASLDCGLKFSINKAQLFDEEHYTPSLHAAQFLWYFIVQNVVPDGSDPALVGTNGDFLWFGVPLYDNRSDYMPVFANYDGGFTGATNKLIYCMDNREYLPVNVGKPLVIGQSYTIDVDILPAIKDAFVNGKKFGALSNCQFQNMQVGYMNFGWELPGSFAVDCSIADWSVMARYE